MTRKIESLSAENADRNEEEKVSDKRTLPEFDAYPQIKNAHATGDGSFGRNNEGLPEEGDEQAASDDSVY